MTAPPTHCRSCEEPIRWVTTLKTGKPMPLNFEPDDDGNVRLEPTAVRNGRQEVKAVVLGPIEVAIAKAAGDVLFMPHHATCPDADNWKGPS